MGMFGGNFANILQTLGAGISDYEGGGGTQNLMALQQRQQAQAQLAQKQAAQQKLMGLFGSQYASDPMTGKNTRSGGGIPSISDPGAIQQLLSIAAAGGDIGPALDVMKANQADNYVGPDGSVMNRHNAGDIGRILPNRANVQGTILDLNDPGNTNRVVSEAPVKGAMPVYDRRGEVVDWNLPNGARNVIGQAAGAEAGAKADFNTVSAQDAMGRPVVTTAGNIARDGPLMGRAPEQEAAAKITAEAGANAGLVLPQTLQRSRDAMTLIDQIGNNPELANRTGMMGVLPAIPGTGGADFDAMSDQLKGKIFQEAYADLRGAGAITEQEGKIATAAIARLDRRQSAEGYKKSLGELRQVITAGVQRAQQRAQAGRAPAPASGIDRSALAAELRRRKLIK